MKLCFQVMFAVIAVSVTSLSARADIVLSGEVQQFVGPGVYTAEIFATAIGQAEEIGGYNIEVDVSNPDITFQSVLYNSAFESILPAAPGSDPVQLQATDQSFAGVQLGVNETASIATLTFNVGAIGDAPISLPFGDTVSDPFFGQIPATVAGPISFTAVPEPSSLALCSLVVTGYLGRRRRQVK